MSKNEKRCSAEVRSPGMWSHYHGCERKSVVVRNGKPYCKIHDPEYVKAKTDARAKEWDRKHVIRALQRELDAAKAAIVDAVLVHPGCKDVVTAHTRYLAVKDKLDEAMKGNAK